MTKVSAYTAASRFAHRVDRKDLPDEVVRYLVKCAVSDLGEGVNGYHEACQVDAAEKKLARGGARYLFVTKAERTSFAADSGTTLPEAELRILWEGEYQAQSFKIATEELVRALVDRDYPKVEATSIAEAVVKEMPPPTNVENLDSYRGPALKRALEIAKRESVIKAFAGSR